MIEVSAAWCSHVSLFFLPLSADVCLSVQVYRRITLCKHWAFALNREHRYSQLMFSLSGATPANRTLYWKVTGKATGHSFIMTRPPLCSCACSCYNGPKLNVTLSRFLPFESCFLERHRRPSDPNLHLRDCGRVGVRFDEVWAGTKYLGYDFCGQKYLGKRCYQCFER